MEILEHVRFVDENLINAQLLEGNTDVARVCLHDRVQILLQFLLLIFNGSECPLIDFAFLGFRDSLFHLVELFLDEGGGCLRRKRQTFELTMRHDDAVPVLRLDLRERPRTQRPCLRDLLAVGSRELAKRDRDSLCASVLALDLLLDGRLRHRRDVARSRLAVILQDEKPRVRIELVELLRELFNDVVWQDIERLVRDAQATHFHACCLHLERLARADAMRDQRVSALEHPPHHVFLVWLELDFLIVPRECEVRAVIFAQDGVVVVVVIVACQALGAGLVAPEPCTEILLHVSGDDVCRVGRLAVECPVLPPAGVDFDGLIVQNIRQQIRKVNSLGFIFAAVPVAIHHPLSIARDELHGKAACPPRDVVSKGLHITRRNPRRAHRDADFIRNQVFRYDLSERVRVLLIARILRCGVLRLCELFPDVAGKILIARLVAFRCRIFENLPVKASGDRLRRASHELCHIRQVYAALVAERDEERVIRAIDGRDFLDRRNRAFLEDCRLFGLLDFLFRAKAGVRHLLQRHHHTGGRVVDIGALSLRVVEIAILLDVGVIDSIELLAQVADRRLFGLRIHLREHQRIQRAPDFEIPLQTRKLLASGDFFCHDSGIITVSVLINLPVLFPILQIVIPFIIRAQFNIRFDGIEGILACAVHRFIDVLGQLVHRLGEFLGNVRAFF